MTESMISGCRVVELQHWVNLHPAALAYARGEVELPTSTGGFAPRSPELARALAEANSGWGNPVDDELNAWLDGATTIVTGQQPGLLGGPLLTLIKAAAVAAEVGRRRRAGERAVGFLWLATADDDLPEMGWARVMAGDALIEIREATWDRGGMVSGRVPLGTACADLLAGIAALLPSPFAQEAIAHAMACFSPRTPLGEATARFLAPLLAGAGVVLVDSLEPAVARAGAPTIERILASLPQAWDLLKQGEADFSRRGWPPPLRLATHKLPVFRLQGDRRESLLTDDGSCPPTMLADIAKSPENYVANVWLRPLVQDLALGSHEVFLGGAELAYHIAAAALWPAVGVARPRWRLRPHVTVVTSVERRLARQLGVEPHQLLSAELPADLRAAGATRTRLAELRAAVERAMAALSESARTELPGLAGDLEATARKLDASVGWLEGRIANAATREAEVANGRWQRLLAFVRPSGQPQERELSVLAPLLRLGLEWPRQLIDALEPDDPGMHLLNWDEGGLW